MGEQKAEKNSFLQIDLWEEYQAENSFFAQAEWKEFLSKKFLSRRTVSLHLAKISWSAPDILFYAIAYSQEPDQGQYLICIRDFNLSASWRPKSNVIAAK